MTISRSLKKTLVATAATLAFVGVAAAQNIQASVAAANAQLATQGKNYRIEMAEYITNLESNEAGQTILFNNRGNRQLAFDFVPGDPRRGARTNITYRTDGTEPSGDAVDTFGAIDGAMGTWEGVACSSIPIADLGDTAVDIGFIQSLVPGFGGNPNILEPNAAGADISHAGHLPGAWFLAAFGPGGGNILGVAFTIIFTDNAGNPTDIDNNGTGDAAYREIYYNDRFIWVNDPNDQPFNGLVDLETVALHEAGHGLSQGHFGRGFITGNGQIHLAPQAVMNAGYIFGQQTLLGTDIGGHCSNWASWPNN